MTDETPPGDPDGRPVLDERRWRALCSELGVEPDASELARLRAAYSEPHRHYHTLAHVASCLAELDRVRAEVPPASRPWIELALWYHDAVYSTRSSKNEEKSADLAADFLERSGAPAGRIAGVRQMILATRHAGEPEGDARWVVDVDLSILGAEPEVFDAYERNVRREYAWVPGFLYGRKRREVLRGFLERPRLYLTEPFARDLEDRARRNLRRSLGGP